MGSWTIWIFVFGKLECYGKFRDLLRYLGLAKNFANDIRISGTLVEM